MNLPITEPDPKHPDMSPEAIDQRLRQLGQIYKMAMSLRNAKWIGPINAPPESGDPELQKE
jgi:hypothetical protein